MSQRSNYSKLLARHRTQLIGSLAAIALSVSTPEGVRAQERVNPRGAVVKGFLDRVSEYTALQQKIERPLPSLEPTGEPSKIEAHQAAMSARVKLARPGARRGDIFGDAEPLIKGIIRQDANGRSARDAWAAMDEVPARDPLRVNAPYPEKAALATVPPLLLMNLPPLPDGLEYRFMGRDLILRDVKVGSSRVDLQACKLEYSIVSPK